MSAGASPQRWLLDDGPFGLLAQCLLPPQNWPPDKLLLSESVAAQASQDKYKRRQGWLPHMKIHPVRLGTPAFEMLYSHLRSDDAASTKDLGEDEAIALCACDPTLADVVFVAQDKGALYQALVELGPGRIASPFDLWLDLRTEGLIEADVYEALCQATYKGDSGIVGLPRRLKR